MARGLLEDAFSWNRSALTGRRAHKVARREALSREAGAAQRRLGRLLLASGLTALRNPQFSRAEADDARLCTLLALKIRDLSDQIAEIDRQVAQQR